MLRFRAAQITNLADNASTSSALHGPNERTAATVLDDEINADTIC
jgi:hypothetical protein